jgi:hypothetical protein
MDSHIQEQIKNYRPALALLDGMHASSTLVGGVADKHRYAFAACCRRRHRDDGGSSDRTDDEITLDEVERIAVFDQCCPCTRCIEREKDGGSRNWGARRLLGCLLSLKREAGNGGREPCYVTPWRLTIECRIFKAIARSPRHASSERGLAIGIGAAQRVVRRKCCVRR